MSTCLLDLGNTRYKWIEASQLTTGQQQRSVYRPANPEGGICTALLAACDARDWLVASVRGAEFNGRLRRYFFDQGGQHIRFATVPDSPPFPLAYENHDSFGIDRYLNLLAARDEYPAPLLVVDAGTAVTIDALDDDGAHRGGVIFPGRNLLCNSLIAGTERVTVDVAAEIQLFGTTTESCVNGGCYYGFQSAISGIIESMQKRLGGHATILITGGDAALLAPALPSSAILDLNLLLKGLGKV